MQTEPFVSQLAVDFIDPLVEHSPYTTSRIAVLKDGTPCSVLQLLAERKFGAVPEGHFPFWIDGDSRNETLSNVALAEREARARRKLKLPGGPDYRKRWRELNPERVLAYTRTAALRKALRTTFLKLKGKE